VNRHGNSPSSCQSRSPSTESVADECIESRAAERACHDVRSSGKVPDTLVACVQRVSADSFVPIFHSLLEQNLSADEIAAAEKFFLSEVGRKFEKAAVVQAYVAVGEQPPEPAPEVSDSEYAELKQFSRTAAGQKLMVQKVMEGQPVRQAVGARVRELLDSCRTK
jgi:hypothetical protein